MSKVKVFIDGSVYSPADPYATALVMQEEEVLWVGQDAGAESIYDETMERIELGGDLLVPAFIQGFQQVDKNTADAAISSLLAAGFSHAVMSTMDISLIRSEGTQDLSVSWLLEVDSLENLSLPDSCIGLAWVADSLSLAELQTLVETKPRILSLMNTHADLVLEYLEESHTSNLPLIRIESFDQWTKDYMLETFAKNQVVVGISLHNGQKMAAEKISATGLPFYLSTDALLNSDSLGWETIRLAIETMGISARAAFNALTKGVIRASALPSLSGQIVPGDKVSLGRWRVDELMVQTADSRVVNWSTDPRARIPLLPVLEEGKKPELIMLYRFC